MGVSNPGCLKVLHQSGAPGGDICIFFGRMRAGQAGFHIETNPNRGDFVMMGSGFLTAFLGLVSKGSQQVPPKWRRTDAIWTRQTDLAGGQSQWHPILGYVHHEFWSILVGIWMFTGYRILTHGHLTLLVHPLLFVYFMFCWPAVNVLCSGSVWTFFAPPRRRVKHHLLERT